MRRKTFLKVYLDIFSIIIKIMKSILCYIYNRYINGIDGINRVYRVFRNMKDEVMIIVISSQILERFRYRYFVEKIKDIEMLDIGNIGERDLAKRLFVSYGINKDIEMIKVE